jgi:glyoxylase-like metal-dependent hydrolase (beta-lactamase superfamily II)
MDTGTLRVLKPAEHVLAFYDGRVAGRRLFAPTPNWIDDGAYELGIASYAVHDGDEAIVYDTHVSVMHAEAIRAVLAEAGIRRIRVVLSHWHLDHVAGNAAFRDCEIVACRLTRDRLVENRAAIEAGTESGPPALAPLVLPDRLFEDRLDLTVGGLAVELHRADIHSQDGVVLLLPGQRLLLAGDTLEDPITYVAEPDRLAAHRIGLDRLEALPFDRILPNHGAPDRIAAGGYDRGLIAATRHYVDHLLAVAQDPLRRDATLRDILAADLEAGHVAYFAPYEAVHSRNIAAVLGAA